MTNNNDYLSHEELAALNLAKCGVNVLISKLAKIVHPERLKIGSHARIDDYCILIGDIFIGDYVHIAAFSLLSGHDGIEINNFCSISARTTMCSAIDDYSGEFLVNPMVPVQYKNALRGKICLEKHVAIGVGTTILPKVIVGEGAAVGAHSLVVVSLKAWGIYFGSPATLIKPRIKTILNLEKELMESKDVTYDKRRAETSAAS